MAKVRPSGRRHSLRIGFLIHDVSRLRRIVVDRALRPMGITRSQWWVLANLARQRNEGMMQTELAEVLDVGKVTLGGLIDRLETAGYVERRPATHDRRAKTVCPTAAGRALLDQIQETAELLNARILGELSAEHVQMMEDGLGTMKKTLNAMLDDAHPVERR
jgi:DNA-binding MarR family transcriptional regulator